MTDVEPHVVAQREVILKRNGRFNLEPFSTVIGKISGNDGQSRDQHHERLAAATASPAWHPLIFVAHLRLPFSCSALSFYSIRSRYLTATSNSTVIFGWAPQPSEEDRARDKRNANYRRITLAYSCQPQRREP